MIEIKEKHESQQRTKFAEHLHNHAHAEILPTDAFKVTRPSFFGGYHPTLKISGILTFTFIVSLTHRMDNLQYNIKFLAIGVDVTWL